MLNTWPKPLAERVLLRHRIEFVADRISTPIDDRFYLLWNQILQLRFLIHFVRQLIFPNNLDPNVFFFKATFPAFFVFETLELTNATASIPFLFPRQGVLVVKTRQHEKNSRASVSPPFFSSSRLSFFKKRKLSFKSSFLYSTIFYFFHWNLFPFFEN